MSPSDTPEPKISETQYQLLAARRQNYDAMLWQTPVISLTAQAFLFTIAFGTGDSLGRLLAALLALVAALASAQLLAKHRYFEIYYARLLEAHELAQRMSPVHARPPKAAGPTGWSSYVAWLWVFFAFAAASLTAMIMSLCQLLR